MPTCNATSSTTLAFSTFAYAAPESVPPLNTSECIKSHRILPDVAAARLYDTWKTLIPTLVDVQLGYTQRTVGKILERPSTVLSACRSQKCAQRRTTLIGLFFDTQVLILNGLFPTSPSQPRLAVSTDLLAFYRALFERSCDAVNALASALHTHYVRRGFHMTNGKGEFIQEPFRRSLGQAILWFDVLQVELESQLERAVQASRDLVEASRNPPEHPAPFIPTADVVPRERCATILLQRCPACFGGVSFGRKLEEGGDIHVATDGNFHHRHRRSAGDSPHFYDPTYFLPKAQVDDIGRHINRSRKSTPKLHAPLVPHEAIDLCENSYEAADGMKQKAAMDSFDDTGIMALICRHDIPLFFANIDTPGEQQKYAVALIDHLFTLLPRSATVVTLYDVGCVLSRSLSQYNILPEAVTKRLRFATTAMHAYGHEWSCQLVYNPRICEGLGLSDGEGTERLWSRFIRLIGIQRSSSRQRRLWLLDRQAAAIGLEMRADLGDWIRRRLKRGIDEQGTAAQTTLDECDATVEDLRHQWALQRQSQLSIRAHAPARLKKELETVFALQGDLDASEKALQATSDVISKGNVSRCTLDAIESLERSHQRLMDKVDVLYASLNIHDKFPELEGINIEFVRTLLLARDLKINIRKCAIGSFFEWDKLDRAVGGTQQALGTKLHQQTRKAISKRQPALLAALRKFNGYCERLEELYEPGCGIPLPTPLPTKLNELRNDQTLMEDIWITPSAGEVPSWLDDQDVRDGIRAMLKRDRCIEEQWFGDELAAIELALQLPESMYYCRYPSLIHALITSQISDFLSYYASGGDISNIFKFVAMRISGTSQETALRWIPQTLISCATLLEEEEVEVEVEVEEEGKEDPEVIATSFNHPPPEHFALGDVMNIDTPDSEGEEDIDIPTEPCALITWHTPERVVVDPVPPMNDTTVVVPGIIRTRVRPARDAFPQQVFEPKDIGILASPTALLNDTLINGCAALLYSESLQVSPAVEQYAILSTHDLPCIRYNASDDRLWRNISWTGYWAKDVWIIPIHRPSIVGHWVLCIVHLQSKEIHLFDSFAEQRPWKSDVKDIMKLIVRLFNIARQHDRAFRVNIDFDGWIARPLITNGYDCGVWVLAMIAATLRGCHSTALKEDNMPAFCHYLRTLVLSIPAF
ncbi:uncharacterized protein EDB93DRAFT_1244054 [Suillus bovinus]|uniref:uncharacterized protein n=1 Tax=Suillus bovinus TaxID=48563 RepID=UPI001B88165D|nr:uncharacterized protein EDB93DRAFT_1244054 [Suillus bovinus]KAG2125361.1 hypothetical protein EDB93DRAFT_1244054 [Suillus bovinus]